MNIPYIYMCVCVCVCVCACADVRGVSGSNYDPVIYDQVT